MANGNNGIKIITMKGGIVFIAGVFLGTFLGFLITFGLLEWRPMPATNFDTIAKQCAEECWDASKDKPDPECASACREQKIKEYCESTLAGTDSYLDQLCEQMGYE